MWELLEEKKKRTKLTLSFLLCALLFTNLIILPSWGATTPVPATKLSILYGGIDYIKFQGFVNGTVPSNRDIYKIPISIYYPKKANKFNGTAIINPRCYTLQETSFVDSNHQSMSTKFCGNQIFTDKLIGGRGYI